MISSCKKHGNTRHVYDKSSKANRCVECRNETTTRHRKKNMRRARSLLDDKCSICGYSKCIAALEFHHKDPSTKLFRLGMGSGYSWKRIKEEAQKCILVCSNCHREIHTLSG